MAVDPSVLAALVAALDADPDNAALRLHLATLLIAAGRPKDALEHCTHVLARQPDHADALRAAAEAAQAAGDPVRADGYRRLAEALGWKQARNLLADVPDRPLPDGPPRRRHAPPDDRTNRDDRDAPPIPLRRGGRGDAGEDKDDDWEPEPPEPLETRITLDDVAGMEAVKRRLNVAFLSPLRNPEMMRMYGKSLRGGLLLYGPPGCGKTFIARATAGELGARFFAVGLSDVLDMYLGQSERNLHAIFETARRSRPSVLFFDELDALGRKRSLMRASAGRDVVNQLLAELDSVGGDNEGVFVLAATNHPWDVDTALRRPGRLDRTLLVLPPDAPAREAIVRSRLRDRPTEGIDAAWIAGKTDFFSGADLVHLCEAAAELAMEDSLARNTVRPILMNDFKRALKEIRPSARAWFDTARNHALFANEGGTYDDLIEFLRTRRML